ncbi:hypothetical protein SCHPADRAFT_994092 [Schizopora paradoxa]|uniref:Uncharacterized protein n=1 Tax=Schizopora paradoxa TaxID=27342 RepID=A0A0H2SKY0_9AGAM|nr:hypothetical protein SCHPADRAFT_994092 [Schizopora paradoxa]
MDFSGSKSTISEAFAVPTFVPSSYAGARCLKRKEQAPEPGRSSSLLDSIKSALKGNGSERNPQIRSTLVPGASEPAHGEDELAWNDNTVVWSIGGVVASKWSFEREEQQIQFACMAWFLQPGVVHSANSSDSSRSKSETDGNSVHSGADSFSPFFRKSRYKIVEPSSITRAAYVFFRSFGKIILSNGLEYTFSLPFLVRQAWSLYPNGVLIQRVLDDSELKPSMTAGSDDFVLPTLFTLTNPFEEPRAVGVLEKIRGGYYEVPSTISEFLPGSDQAVDFVPAGERVLHVSTRNVFQGMDLIVTISSDRRKLSFWHYAYEAIKTVPSKQGGKPSKRVLKQKAGVHAGPSTQSAMAHDMAARGDRIREPSPEVYEETQPAEMAEAPLFGMPVVPPTLSNTTTLASIATGNSAPASWPPNTRRSSFTRNDLTSTMDRMVLGRRSDIGLSDAVTQDTIQPAFWMAKLLDFDLDEDEAASWQKITFGLYEFRKEGDDMRALMLVCSPIRGVVHNLRVECGKEQVLKMEYQGSLAGIAAVPVLSVRPQVMDLLVLTAEHQLVISTYSGKEIPIDVKYGNVVSGSQDAEVSVVAPDGDVSISSLVDCQKIISIRDAIHSCVTVVFEDGSRARVNVNLLPKDELTLDVLAQLGNYTDPENFFDIHMAFLDNWFNSGKSCVSDIQFECLSRAILSFFGCIPPEEFESVPPTDPWLNVLQSPSAKRLKDDTALGELRIPIFGPKKLSQPIRLTATMEKRTLMSLLSPLHFMAEELRLFVPAHRRLSKLARLIIRLATPCAPGWAEYWKRLFPSASDSWDLPPIEDTYGKEDNTWPHDISASLFSRLASPEGSVGLTKLLSDRTAPRFTYFQNEPPHRLMKTIAELFDTLCDTKFKESRKRAEETILKLAQMHCSSDFLNLLPISIAIPLREAARTCQVGPPASWPLMAYEFVGRNDLTEASLATGDILFNDGYRSMKDHLNHKIPRKTYRALFEEAHKAVHHGEEITSGVELDLADFTDIRFGQDRRLQEVARMLRSSVSPTIRMQEKPELSEHDLAKEQQAQVLKTAERTLALPLGRAMFTFGSVPTVKKEICTIPKIELSIRVTPNNALIAPEVGKIPAESIQWAEFHNGVAAALRIAPSSGTVDSSWIAFNKPNELSAEHAGFLYGLGLTGHLKEMLTWHTFGYLTPKHDLTSIGVLLGLSAANVGTGNRHVTKLLAVHTPALLPVEGVELNVPLLTQASGLVGIGLLYMSTKNRRMAEVALHQLSRKDLMSPDISNEYREAYVLAAAFSFGMIMLGRGTITSSPADVSLLARLRVLIHGEGPTTSTGAKEDASFDVNLTSPAATLALGLMFLRTNRQDVADVLTIPDTILSLNSIQPNFLLVRTLCRALIMWDSVKASKEWVQAQIPESIAKAIEARSRGKAVDDAVELAYYNIVSGCCFALGLKYAGTAREEAYTRIIEYYDFFNRSSNSSGPAYDHKIKRVAVRDGLNLASLSLNMVMAGTGEINCLRRLRYAHGMYNAPIRYGSHMATHMALGMLFLGGGRFTLGSSDAAIACMVAAFFPRFPALSSDNRSYLQAMRHLWVLAVEPRCLVARDVDTKEVIYLPTKIRFKEGDNIVGAQMISPTLIPSLDRLLSIKVDTPRYWPFYLDIANCPPHKETLLRSQTLYVKRRTMFLSYLEDPKGSRSLFVRSGMSTGEAASLDHPQLSDGAVHPASDLHQFITSHSNDISFIAFADRFCRGDGVTEAEKVLSSFCHAALLDCIIQDKPQVLSSYLMLYRTRIMNPRSRYFQLEQQEITRVAEFYLRLFERRFSGRTEGITRPSLIRESSVVSAVNAVSDRLRKISDSPELQRAIRAYILNQRDSPDLQETDSYPDLNHHIAWYLSKHAVPFSAYLPRLREYAKLTLETLTAQTPEEERDAAVLEEGVKFLVHQSIGMFARLSTYWSIESFEHALQIWQNT